MAPNRTHTAVPGLRTGLGQPLFQSTSEVTFSSEKEVVSLNSSKNALERMVMTLWNSCGDMTRDRGPVLGSFHFVCTLAFIVGSMIQFSEALESAADYSNRNLTHVPKDLPPGTKALNLSHNSILELQVSDVSFLPELRVLRLSHNRLQRLDFGVFQFNPDLEYLDVSHNQLRNISCCPMVKVLDLHNNRIISIPQKIIKLDTLQELNVASNSLMDLPGCGAFSSLSVLVIEHNLVSQPSADFFQSCQKIRSITAGNNPFRCTCELREFVKNIGQVSGEVIEGWPGSYTCDSPESAKGTPLKDFHMSPLSCDTVLLIVTIGATLLVLAVIVAFLCLCFDLPWYLRMVCQWTQTRHRARNIPIEELQRNFQFHAFVSYSEHDSAWVKNELLPNLEKDDIRVCLHERNFIPGKSIVENIIHFIEKSYKSIFVLSPHFIQSEWCHYELYFAHHNLFHEGSDNLILILLEPILQDNIPRFILTKTQLSDGSQLIIRRPRANLTHVPKDLPLATTTLDISQNNISELQASDMALLSELRALMMSYNRLQCLDFGVFESNRELEYLDLSHNELRVISCHSAVNFKHLDLSFNGFDALPICKEFGNMSRLEFLGLSGTKVQNSSVQSIAHLNMSKVLLVLGDAYGEKEDPETLQHFRTRSLHIVFPVNRTFHFILDVSVSPAVNLELSNINCGQKDNESSYFLRALSKLEKNGRLSNLTLNNVEITWNSFVDMLQRVWHSPVKYFSISNLKLQGNLDTGIFNYSDTSLKALSIHQVVSDAFSLPQAYLYSIFSNMNIPNVTVSGTRMLHMLCPSQLSPFLYLDFTDNLLTDLVFKDCRNLIELKTLSLQRNQLKKLENIILMSAEMISLQKLDISQNSLRCLPPKVKVLDLHNNRIMRIPKDVSHLQALQELNVASNSLTDLPGCGAFSSLSVLVIEHNLVSQPSADFFQSCQKIRSITAGNNPFRCTCELREFVKNIGQVSGEVVEGWPGSYMCDSPESAKGTPLKDFHMSPLSCDTVLLIVTIGATLLVLAVIVAFLCLRFDLPWYLRMVCQWTQTRHRARNIPIEELQRNFQFHAFVSYSGHDSTWVKNELLPNLEKDDIRVCLHERNFIPGKSIVENIIHFIEKSYKSIFVLSPHFIQSEWCHYELYFAHHNLFHEGSDNLILILLEPIPQFSIPSNYNKLKTLMARKTYLEWPREKSKHGLFWANLRATINVKLVNQAETICHIQR
ncbi:hypothetical protein STEG23_011071 [Scotinomys teguina]